MKLTGNAGGVLRGAERLKRYGEDFLHDGEPLGPHHITSAAALARVLGRLGEVLGSEAPETYPVERAIGRAGAYGYVLPPSFLQLQLLPFDLLVGNAPETRRFTGRMLTEAGFQKGELVAVHHFGLNLDVMPDTHVYLNTLHPDLYTAAPLAIRAPLDSLFRRLKYGDFTHGSPPNIIDPMRLILENTAAVPEITTPPAG